ncbi:hypothetical protein HRW12_00360 [Streptomyces lunaelactis]|uniref:hypothetical protein n=1 Tax=Streptomyces lunaelactis TaxID=1535768 RepID=UPI001584E49D|nr:hypothetical protein [Streptomyces lunaelactis]NUK32250.1 hypothetical protein [Streptomyces lunaelactis]NUK41260.1 hypothetical protein [Streptomyces lunaelactis]
MDAVRRQHQRDAYAAFLTTANTYSSQTEWRACFEEARAAVGISAFFEDRREEVEQRAIRIRASVQIDPVRAAAAVVSLEGPERIAALAEDVVRQASQVRLDAREGNGPGAGWWSALLDGRQPDPEPPAHLRLTNAINAFTMAARSHLNGSKASGT